MEFRLRPLRNTDVPSFARHANDPLVARNLTDGFPHPYTRDHAKALIQRTMALDGPLIMCIDVDGRAMGAIGVHPLADISRLNAELGYWVARELWGKGIVTAAVRQMVPYAFGRLPQIQRIYARPFGSNIASQRVLQKAGFTLEAHLKGTLIKGDRIEDELIYAVRREAVNASPSET
jgi:RimJ/RimL family protein N-acetyltransferase